MQHELPELTLDGDELLVDRDVSDGTSESLSESMYESESELDTDEAGDMVCLEKRLLSWSSVALSYCVLMTWRVWCGRSGFGAMIFDGESERPLGIDAVLARRESFLEDLCDELSCRRWDDDAAEALFLPGMSRMLSLRPVVGSVVFSLAGSCDTWYPSMM